MSLPNYLAKIKSSGIYRFVWDKSEIDGVPAEVLRLVVGYSEKGPFNTPVYVKSDTEFISVFGDISKKLEKRGIFFHRLALQALAKGPIIALNLKKFENEKVDACSFNVVDDIIDLKGVPVKSIYDTTRFWKLDPEAILPATGGDKKYISITSADSKDTSCSIFIRGFKPAGYDVTVSNWYSSQGEEVPDYFRTDDGKDYSSMLVSDFWAEIYVFRGEFTNTLCIADPLNKYFDVVDGKPQLKEYVENAFGEKVDTLEALAADDASNFVNSYSGCLLPFFKSQTGSYVSLDLNFNSDNGLHKMMMNLNSDLLYNGDVTIDQLITTGWTANTAFGAALKHTEEAYSATVTETYADPDNTVLLNKTYSDFAYSPVEGHEATAFDPDFITFEGAKEGDKYCKYLGGYEYAYEGEAEKTLDGTPVSVLLFKATGDPFLTFEYVALYNDTTYGVDGDVLVTDPETSVKLPLVDLETLVIKTQDDTQTAYYRYEGVEEDTNYKMYERVYGDEFTESTIYSDGGNLYYKDEGQYHALVDITSEIVNGETGYKFDFVSVGLVVGDRVVYNGKFYTISELSADYIRIFNVEGEEKLVYKKSIVKKCNHSASITCYELKPYYFEGYVYENAAPKPNTLKDWAKLQWHKFILSTLIDEDGLRVGLTSKADIDFRYVVDTFEGLVDAEEHKELALICKQKDNALGFLNFPAIKTFKNCEYSSFTDENGKFQMKYIAEGANKKKSPAVLFSLVSELNGASYVSYNTPLTFSDGTVKTNVPSAALVSNNFMEKYESRQPYYIVAGPTYGRMIAAGLVGPEFNFTRADLDILEPMGVNAMVYVPRLGTYINSNQTAKQNPVTALSKLNVRELVIYLQDEIEKLLQDYQWEFNTPYLRDLVKAKADTICEKIKNNGGLYQFLNVCDESNNTDDVINNEMFVLSTSIEPGMGCGKMVQELTIYKKGQMSAIIK